MNLSSQSCVHHRKSSTASSTAQRLRSASAATGSNFKLANRFRASKPAVANVPADTADAASLPLEDLLIAKYRHVFAGDGGLFHTIQLTTAGRGTGTSSTPLPNLSAGGGIKTTRSTAGQNRQRTAAGARFIDNNPDVSITSRPLAAFDATGSRQRRATSASRSSRASWQRELSGRRPETASFGCRSRKLSAAEVIHKTPGGSSNGTRPGDRPQCKQRQVRDASPVAVDRRRRSLHHGYGSDVLDDNECIIVDVDDETDVERPPGPVHDDRYDDDDSGFNHDESSTYESKMASGQRCVEPPDAVAESDEQLRPADADCTAAVGDSVGTLVCRPTEASPGGDIQNEQAGEEVATDGSSHGVTSSKPAAVVGRVFELMSSEARQAISETRLLDMRRDNDPSEEDGEVAQTPISSNTSAVHECQLLPDRQRQQRLMSSSSTARSDSSWRQSHVTSGDQSHHQRRLQRSVIRASLFGSNKSKYTTAVAARPATAASSSVNGVRRSNGSAESSKRPMSGWTSQATARNAWSGERSVNKPRSPFDVDFGTGNDYVESPRTIINNFRITPMTYDSRYADMAAAAAFDERWRERGGDTDGRWNESDESSSLDSCLDATIRKLAILKCTAWLDRQHMPPYQTARDRRVVGE